jgi:hypothetical protein
MCAGISERSEDVGYARQDTAVKIEHAQKMLKGRKISGSRKKGLVGPWI